MSFILRTLKYFRRWFSGGNIRVTANDPNNDADLESYQITTKNGNGSEQTIRMHELEGVTVKSTSGVTVNVLDNGQIIFDLTKNGIYSYVRVTSDGGIELSISQDSGSVTGSIYLSGQGLRISLADQNQGMGNTDLILNANSLQTLKTLLGL